MRTNIDEAFPAEHRQRSWASAPRKAQLARHLRRAFSWAACSLALLALPKLAAAQEVSLAIENPEGPVVPGQGVVYSLRVANRSATAPTGALTLEANIPQHMAVTGEPWGRCSPKGCGAYGVARYGDVVSWALPSLAPGESTLQLFRATIDNTAANPAPSAGTELVLEALVKSGAVRATSAASRVLVQTELPGFDLSVIGTPRAVAGGPLEYTFRYGNRSTVAASSGVLRVPVPPGARVLMASQGAVQRGSTIEWNTGSLAAGHSDVRVLRLQLSATAKSGTFLSIEPELVASGQKVASRASASTFVGAPSPLELKLVAAPDPVQPGGTIVYKLEVTNKSTSVASGDFTVGSRIPRHTRVTGQATGICSPEGCGAYGVARYGSFIFWNVKSLAPGATVPLQFTGIIDKPTNAAPPPNGSLLTVEAWTSAKEARTATHLVIGTPGSAGKGTPLVPLGAAPSKPVATAKPAPPPQPPPAVVPVAVVEPEPEPAVEEIPDEEVVAELPPADDENKISAVEVKQRTKWKALDWDKYCAKRWRAHAWDRHCAKRWWKQKDWNKFCKAEGKKHRGWKKYCARDFNRWKFAKSSKWGKRKHSTQRKQARPRQKQ